MNANLLESFVVRPLMIENNTLFSTHLIDTNIIVRVMIDLCYALVNVVHMIIQIVLLVLVGIKNVVVYCGVYYGVNYGYDYMLDEAICMLLITIGIIVVAGLFEIKRHVDSIEAMERKIKQLYFINDDNFARIAVLENKK
jgi:hypothetical protein